MALGHRFGVVFAAATVAVASIAGTALADTARTVLYREDAVASFEVRDPSCPADRTKINLSFHKHFLRQDGGPVERGVMFGVAIQQFDCQEQFVLGAEGNETFFRRFDVVGRLRSADIDTTIEACVTFPARGGCFPVRIHLDFDGVGKVEVTKDRTHVNDPNCKLNHLEVLAIRQARVSGRISYTEPGGPRRTFSLSSADLSSAGAALTAEYTRSMIDGTDPPCINQ